jgi:maltose O-acetyltransferase
MMRSLVLRLLSTAYNLVHQHHRAQQRKQFRIPASVEFNSISLEGNVMIGENTYVNDFSRIDSGDSSSVKIGRHCAIGRYVHITSRTHDLTQPTTDETHPQILHEEADVIVGNYVWIGDKVTILPGVRVGDYAVIAANAVVTENVGDFEIVGGIPAKVIRVNRKHYKFPNPAAK